MPRRGEKEWTEGTRKYKEMIKGIKLLALVQRGVASMILGRFWSSIGVALQHYGLWLLLSNSNFWGSGSEFWTYDFFKSSFSSFAFGVLLFFFFFNIFHLYLFIYVRIYWDFYNVFPSLDLLLCLRKKKTKENIFYLFSIT
jgi:hypothetical protein